MSAQTKLTPDEILHVAKLAQLPLTTDEVQKYHGQLLGILQFISKLQQLNTHSVPPTSQVTGLTNVFREDEVDVTRMLSQTQALANAPAQHNGYFLVPAIFEQ